MYNITTCFAVYNLLINNFVYDITFSSLLIQTGRLTVMVLIYLICVTVFWFLFFCHHHHNKKSFTWWRWRWKIKKEHNQQINIPNYKKIDFNFHLSVILFSIFFICSTSYSKVLACLVVQMSNSHPKTKLFLKFIFIGIFVW